MNVSEFKHLYEKENKIQSNIMKYLDLLSKRVPIYFFRAGSGMIKIHDEKKDRFFRTGRKGCPDIILLIRGKFVGLECKKIDGRLTAFQKSARKEIESAGGYYRVVSDIRDVEEVINLIIKKKTPEINQESS